MKSRGPGAQRQAGSLQILMLHLCPFLCLLGLC